MTAPDLPSRNLYLESIGPTPLIPVQLGERGSAPTIWCKLEFLNPSGSTKDRIASFILAKAWRTGAIGVGSLVVEASSGSTSIAMAMVCAQLGVRFRAVMPEGVSAERTLMIRAYGGEISFSPREAGIAGALAEAERVAREEGAFLPAQFSNVDNAAAHRFGTAREVLRQIPGSHVDAVVSGVGTGGTLVGLYHGFRDHGCHVAPVAARPVVADTGPGDAVLSQCFREAECCSYSSRIPGVVDGMSTIYRPDELEGLIELDVPDDEAIATTRALVRMGFPVGASSGLNYVAAIEIAQCLGTDKHIVTVFPDRMERYFSTGLFDEK